MWKMKMVPIIRQLFLYGSAHKGSGWQITDRLLYNLDAADLWLEIKIMLSFYIQGIFSKDIFVIFLNNSLV